MIYCVNPTCSEPQNSDVAKTCRCCGSFLQLHDRYTPLRRLGQGGSGRTFLALDTFAIDTFAIDNDAIQNKIKRCVIKQIPSLHLNEKAIQQKVQGLKRASHHPHLPHFIDVFSVEDYFYFVHEWIEGRNLTAELTESETLDESEIWQILNEILPALKLLHECQLVHQDIKPANIIRRANQMVLVDLGSAEVISAIPFDTALPQVGSPEYAAPEQVSGKVCFASDLYSLGMTCLYLLTALSPFDLFDSILDRWVWQDYLTQSVSNALAQVLNQLTQRSIQHRFASAQETIETIQTLQAQTYQPKRTFQPLKPTPYCLTPLLSFPSHHTANINAVAFHPQLPVIVSASDDKTIRLWDRNTQQLLTVLTGHRSSVRSIAFSPNDETLIASASDDKTIHLWNWQAATRLAILQGHQASVRSITFSPDGKLLISGSWDKTIGIWQVETVTKVATFRGHSLQINAVALNEDATWLASGSADRTARLWQFQTSEIGLSAPLQFPPQETAKQSILVGHTWAVTAVAFSPDGQLLATGSNDNTVKLWHVQTGELLHTLTGHSWSVAALQFSSDSQHLFSGSWDQTIKVWQAKTGEELATLRGHTDAIHTIGVTCDFTNQNTDQLQQIDETRQTNWVVSGGRDRQLILWRI